MELCNSTMLSIKLLEVNNGQIEGLQKNPRFIKDENFKKLVKSIEDNPEMTAYRELLVYPKDGKYIVIGGNMRLRACKALGYKEIPCKILPKETSVEQLQQYTIKDNSNYGEWDLDLLANEWDLTLLSDCAIEIPAIEISNDEEPETKEDDFDEQQDNVTTRCASGDVWKLGSHRLMCGDSTNIEHIKKLMDGNNVDLYLTDPPYNVNYEGGTESHLKIMNDSMSDENFKNFLQKAFAAADSVLKKGGAFYIWHADLEGLNFRSAVKSVKWDLKQCLIWNKNSMVLGRQDYQWKHEPCLYGWKAGASHSWYSNRKQTTVIDYQKPSRSEDHPTMKPVGLFGYLIENSSKKDDIVLDSFGGSGTTIVACEQLGRRCYTMELDPHYCDVIIARWEKLTGREAVKI